MIIWGWGSDPLPLAVERKPLGLGPALGLGLTKLSFLQQQSAGRRRLSAESVILKLERNQREIERFLLDQDQGRDQDQESPDRQGLTAGSTVPPLGLGPAPGLGLSKIILYPISSS